MEFEWDEAKRRLNRRKHGLDLADARRINWDRALLVELQLVDGEEREKWLGALTVQIVAVITGPRSGRQRIISLRKATPRERRAYFDAQTSP